MRPGDDNADSSPPRGEATRFTERYEVRGELARGGLGRILVARDRLLDRPVAIKVLLASARADDTVRFARETRITAKLEHPAIVPVHDSGVTRDGSPYYTMKLVSGRSLHAVIADRETLLDRLSLVPHVIAACEAIAYAHASRIIHRDLTPRNILIGSFGETVVIDWGLGKELGTADQRSGDRDQPERNAPEAVPRPTRRAITQQGAVLGTPQYMAPEQAMGEEVDERTDVYALGAILYHVLAGRPLYQGHDVAEILAFLIADPPPLDELPPAVPDDLVAIVAKATARDPGDRYPTAEKLADDLVKFETGQIVGAYRYSTTELVHRWVRRHRLPLAVALVLTAALAVVTAAGGGGGIGLGITIGVIVGIAIGSWIGVAGGRSDRA